MPADRSRELPRAPAPSSERWGEISAAAGAAVPVELAVAVRGRYSIVRELGHGGMATVYLARDLRHGRPVAIKLLRTELAAAVGAARFLREIAVAAELQHPNILPLLDSGEADGLLYYVMPYIDGDSLRTRLDRMRQLPVDEALRITCEVADALDYAHRHGVVHRDVKPENVLLEDGHAVIADFGIARALSGAGPDTLVETLTATGVAVGTPAYMSPEQAAGGHDVDGRSDVYSLGCLLYELLAGQPPFHGPTAESVVRQHLTAPPPPIRMLRPAAPAHVEAALERALAKAPADRFQTATELRDALRQGDVEGRGNSARAGHNTALAPADQSIRATGAATRRPILGRRALVFVLGMAVLAVIGIWMLNRRPAALAVARAPTPAAAPATPRWVLVADFDGPPDDPTLGIAVRELVTAVLGESKTLATVPRDHLQSARRAAMLADSAVLTGERARHLAFRTAVHTVVEGRVDQLGANSYSIVVRAVNVPDGAAVATASASANESTIIPVVQQLARQIRSTLGDRPDTTSAGVLLSDVITPSFDAYRKLTEANERNRQGDFAAARKLARDAVTLDGDFAWAWVALGAYYGNLNIEDSAQLAWTEAMRRPDRLTTPQRLTLERIRAEQRGDQAMALQLQDRAIQEEPFNASLHYTRTASLLWQGRHEEATSSFRRAIELSPLGPPPLFVANFAGHLTSIGQIDEARALTARLQGVYAQTVPLQIAVAAAATAEDWAHVDSLATALSNDPTQILVRRARAVVQLASSRAARGRIAAADQSLLHAARVFEVEQRFVAGIERARLFLSVVANSAPVARTRAERGDTTHAWLLTRALWDAVVGDTVAAMRALRTVHVPESSVILQDVALVSASVAARQERWLAVVQTLGPGAWKGVPSSHVSGSLDMRRWLTGEAYDRLNRPDSAVAYFEMLVTPVRTIWHEQLSRGLAYGFAHRRLALLYSRLDRPEKARHHWQMFLGTFTEPDPQYRPLVEDAKRQLDLLR